MRFKAYACLFIGLLRKPLYLFLGIISLKTKFSMSMTNLMHYRISRAVGFHVRSPFPRHAPAPKISIGVIGTDTLYSSHTVLTSYVYLAKPNGSKCSFCEYGNKQCMCTLPSASASAHSSFFAREPFGQSQVNMLKSAKYGFAHWSSTICTYLQTYRFLSQAVFWLSRSRT